MWKQSTPHTHTHTHADVPAPWIVLEFLTNGDLKSFLSKNSKPLSKLVKYMVDVSMGMHYLSERGLVHRVSCVGVWWVASWDVWSVSCMCIGGGRLVEVCIVCRLKCDYLMVFNLFTITHRILLLATFWLLRMRPVKWLISVSFESSQKTTRSTTCRPMYLVQFAGCHRRASLIVTSPQHLMCGVLVSWSGRCSTPPKHLIPA